MIAARARCPSSHEGMRSSPGSQGQVLRAIADALNALGVPTAQQDCRRHAHITATSNQLTLNL
jgi:hypothetical protein